MRSASVILLLLIVTLCAARVLTVERPVRNQYIAVLRRSTNASLTAVRSFVSSLHPAVSLRRRWAFSDFAALSIETASKEALEKIAAHPEVDFVEKNGIVRASQQCNKQTDATWGIDRVNHDKPDLDGDFIYSSNGEGEGITAYVVDTGIRVTHTEFGGRAVWGTNTIDTTTTDDNGHGTHVAGTIGGHLYGVAKGVTLVAVKVLNAKGSGSYESIIDGLEWVIGYNQGGKKKGIANLSLGGGKSTALNQAADAVSKAGILMVVAAGNENTDACSRSPASASTVVSVGASTLVPVEDGNFDEEPAQEDQRSSFSNFGPCVKVFAPGSMITSAWYTSDTAIHTISGTSMASPHVAGVAAALWSKTPSKTSAELQSELSGDAIPNIVNLNCANSICKQSNNRFVHLPHC